MKKVNIKPDRDGGCWVECDGSKQYVPSRIDAYRIKANIESMQQAGASIERDRSHGGKSWGYYVDGQFVGGLDRFK